MANVSYEKDFPIPSVAQKATPRWPVVSLSSLVKTVFEWRDRARQRRRLSQLDDHFLRDIGLTRAEVEEEARKPFWVS